MAYIQPNKLLPPTSRVIRPFQCSMIACEGPNILGKLNMSGVEIPYYTQFTTRMILNPESTNQPLHYGFLGSDVTFVLLKITYDETDPRCQIEEEQYIEYYFEDQPFIKRYTNKLLLLTGNSTHRIPQIYLNNPGEIKVYIDAMVGNLEETDNSSSDSQALIIDNLYYNSIISDTIWSQICFNSGSSQLQVRSDGYIQLYLDYVDILTIESVESTYELRITTVSDTIIILRFLSLFDMYQARSRISWVTKLPNERYLTAEQPGLDLFPPVFEMDPYLPTGTTTYSYPFVSGTITLPSEVLAYFVTGITDERDGEIPVDNSTIVIRQYGFIEPLTSITHAGVYNVVITISDLAYNRSMLNFNIICDDVPPVITFKPLASGTGFTMTDVDMGSPTEGITYSDIIRKSVDNVYDVVDGPIPNSDITISIDQISGTTGLTHIADIGNYLITYYIADRAGNSVTYEKYLKYDGCVILNSGQLYTYPIGSTSIEFRYLGGIGTTATINISGYSFIIASVSGETNEELIWDLGGSTEYNFGSGNTGSIYIIIEGISYEISFTGRGSLYFNIKDNGSTPHYFTVTPESLSFEYSDGLTDTISIDTDLNWIIDESIPWITFSSNSGNSSETITCTTTDKNITGFNRSGLTTVYVDDPYYYQFYQVTVEQSSITPIYENDVYTYTSDIELVYLGERFTTASVVITEQTFIIFKNISDNLIWNYNEEGISDTGFTFTEVGQYVYVIVGGDAYKITLIGDDLVFSISMVDASTEALQLEVTTEQTDEQILIIHERGYNNIVGGDMILSATGTFDVEYKYNYVIDYGDGSPYGTVTSYDDQDTIHTYSEFGSYVIKIYGICESIQMTNNSNLNRIISWGNVNLMSIKFEYSYNLTSIPDDVTGLSGVTSFVNVFRSCTSLTGNVPELWTIFNELDGTNCFYDDTMISNYNSIPVVWGGVY